jgi:DNA-binding PadR family transcriptional regulator
MRRQMTADPHAFLPLPPHDFHLLVSLADGPRHAYGLAGAVEAQAPAGLRLEIGSLYRMLARLTSAGLIEEHEPASREGGHEERRRYYRLTPFGRRVAQAEAARLQAAISLARRHKLLPGRRSS